MSEWAYARLAALHAELTSLRDEIEMSDDWCASSARGVIADRDWRDLGDASDTVHRLMLDVKYPSVNDDSSYLLRRALKASA